MPLPCCNINVEGWFTRSKYWFTAWGQGTQRLPSIIGAEQALEAILSGDQIPAPKALELGIIDEVVPSKRELLEAAIEWQGK